MSDYDSLELSEEEELLYCRHCNQFNSYTKFENGYCPNCGKLHSEYRPRRKECPKCKSKNSMRDKFCKYCGTALLKEFKPYLNFIDCIYGPPPMAMDFICKSCGKKWTGLEDERYCPKCGSDDLDLTLIDDRDDAWYEFWNLDKEEHIKQTKEYRGAH